MALLRRRGLDLLRWSGEARRLQGRVALLGDHDCAPGQWPDFSDSALLDSLEQWLPPYLNGVTKLRDIQALDVEAMLLAQLDWPQQQALQRAAPERIGVPSGSKIRVDYRVSPPVLAVKLQEMFGCEDTPRVAEGRQPLLVHLLSPAQRPLQVTSDLAGFWRSSYEAVKKEMKGRYPKHPWPDDPMSAQATAYTKARAARQR
jgi:ATP-dependent helicase HrpB